MASSDGETENNNNTPSRVLLILVRGSRESLSSRTTFVLFSKAGSIRVNFIMCPGNHEGGPGSAERWVKAIVRTRGMADSEFNDVVGFNILFDVLTCFFSESKAIYSSHQISEATFFLKSCWPSRRNAWQHHPQHPWLHPYVTVATLLT